MALRCAALMAAVWAAAGGARAQSITNSGGAFNAGYGGRANSMNGPIDVSTRDENGNTVFVNGMMQTPAGSVFSRVNGFSQNASSGVGGNGLATAIGNNLQVVVNGSFNVVNVESTQINNGDITATTSLNGQVNLDGP
jgi:holdfast attachment protein HfaA